MTTRKMERPIKKQMPIPRQKLTRREFIYDCVGRTLTLCVIAAQAAKGDTLVDWLLKAKVRFLRRLAQ